MGYYQAGDYYLAGDPGIFGFIGRAAKKVAGTVIGATPIGGVVKTGIGILSGYPRRGTLPPMRAAGPGGMTPTSPFAGAKGQVREGQVCKHGVTPSGKCRKRPTMNPTNPKALKRAIRRQDAFVKLARKAMKGSNFQVVSRASRRASARRKCR